MKSLLDRITALALCLTLLLLPRPAKADSLQTAAIEVSVAIAAAGAAIGIGVYYAVSHRNSSLTGCATLSPDNLTLLNESDHQTYTLVGDIANIKTGDRIHVSGKRQKNPPGKQTFLVDKLAKDYGPCKVSP